MRRCLGCMEKYDDKFDVCPHCGYAVNEEAPEAVHMEAGTLLADRYIIGKVVGYGGFGVTYLAWDGKLQQKVAIKEYFPSEFSTRMPGESMISVFGGDKSEQYHEGMRKFIEEAKKLAKFKNEDGIVKIFDSFEENETAYIIMEYLDGETLSSYLKREGVVEEEEAVRMLTPVLKSLQAVHSEGILHRDIAPDNIFITKDGDVKLIDFGASRYATTSHSRSLTVIVKPGYSPEEQYRSRGDQGPWTDVYAIAATMYKMVTGKTPPDAMERRAKFEGTSKDIMKEPHEVNKQISPVVDVALLNALNVRVEDRTQDVATFYNELTSDKPAKRLYGKIKKLDLYRIPTWVKVTVPALLAIVAVLTGLLFTGVIKFNNTYTDTITVPDGWIIVPEVEGLTKKEAIELLEEKNLIGVLDSNIDSENWAYGTVVYQSPGTGEYKEAWGDVVLVVSAGRGVEAPKDGYSIVPYIEMDTEKNAISKLKQAGLAEPEISYAYDNNVTKGNVISQDPEPGTKLKEGTKIKLVVSKGSQPYTIQFNANGGSCSKTSKSVQYGSTYGDLPTPTRSGYAFTGWFTSADGGDRITSGSKVSKTSTHTLYAHWSNKFATITFDANGGSVSETSRTIGSGEAIGTLPAPSRTGYTFNGWYTSASGGNVVTSTTTYKKNATIYAHWTINTYTVTFNANGGSCSTGSARANYGSSVGTLPTATRTGYTFAGWYTSGGSQFTESTALTANITVYAKWNANTYTVTFNANGGSCSTGSKNVKYASTYGSLPTPSRDYYSFAGWYTAASGGSKVTESTTYNTAGNTTLYAHWTLYSYSSSWTGSGTGYSITVTRTSSPYAGASTGTISSGTTLYYGDTLSISYNASTGYNVSSTGVTSITVTRNITSSDIYMSVSPISVTYNIQYVSSNGTSLGSSTVTYNYGTTNTISPKSFTGYSSPGSQTISWDSTSAKTITFKYTPKSVGTQTVTNSYTIWADRMWCTIKVEIGSRTSSGVQLRYTFTTDMVSTSYYGYSISAACTLGSTSLGTSVVKPQGVFASLSRDSNTYTYTSSWTTVSAGATTSSISAKFVLSSAGFSPDITISGTISIPTY